MTVHAAQTSPDASRAQRTPTVAEERARVQKELAVQLLLTEREPLNADAWKEAAISQTRLGMYADAVQSFERAVTLDPDAEDDHLVWVGMGVAAWRSGVWALALKAFEHLIRLYPEEPVQWIFKAMALENLGEPEDAEAALRQAAAIEATPETIVAISFALGLLDRYDEALELDEQAIDQNPDNAYAFANKGAHLAKKALRDGNDGLIEEADAAFQRAIRLAPHDATIRRNYGVMLGGIGKYEQALARLEEALELMPGSVATLRSLGFVHTKRGDPGDHERALELDLKAIAIAPRHPVAWRSKGVDLLNLGRYEEALAAFAEASRLAPRHADMWHAKGSALWRLGQYKEAEAAFAEGLTICEGKSADALIGLGATRGALGDHEAALAHLREAVATAADRPELWAMLGRTYRQLGNPQAAEHAFRRGFEVEPSMAMARRVIDALAAQDREGDALAFLAETSPHDRDDAEIAYWRGVLLTRLGREGEATVEFAAASRQWQKAGVVDARSTDAARAAEHGARRRAGALSWSDHWFGQGSQASTRVVGVGLLCALLAAFALPLAASGSVGSLDYGAGWAAITLPITVLVLLLALPTVQTIKAGGGSFEVTTIPLQDREPWTSQSLPSDIPIDKISDLPTPDSREAVASFTEEVGAILEAGIVIGDEPKAGSQRRAPG
jgi:tetratricopeptide (TPR) repeat protein